MNLSDVEARILGSLVEKESITPDNYPLSLNALTAACNQLSNRDPVMSLSEDQVKWAVNSLRQQSLVRAIQAADARVMKFQHLLTEKLGLSASERAVLAVLLLRGAQTLGEIRSRTSRLAEFTSIDDVESTVKKLIGSQLVAELPRRPGQKEARYAHLLSGPPKDTAPSETSVDLDQTGESRGTADDRIASLERAVEELRVEVAELRARIASLESK